MYGTSEGPPGNIRAVESSSLNSNGKETWGSTYLGSSSECKVLVRTCNVDGVVDVGISRTRQNHREIKDLNYKCVAGSKEQIWRGQRNETHCCRTQVDHL